MHAYVLITADPGEMGHVATATRKLKKVSAATILGGPYDILVDVRTTSFDDLSHVVARIHDIPGVARTVTCEGDPSIRI